MCYHTSTPGAQQLKLALPEKRIRYDADSYYHVSGFTRPYLPVTLNVRQDEIEEAQWKLLPFWVKTEEEAKKYANTLNAESESIFEKASYKNYITKYRGLLWVDGFFEPHKNRVINTNENYYIYKPEKKIFSLGIVYSNWTNQETGEIIPTFSIITTKANPLLEDIHNEKKRMPLIIGESDRDAWLFASQKEDIQSLMQPYSGILESHKVVRVTADRTGDTDRPDIQDRIN